MMVQLTYVQLIAALLASLLIGVIITLMKIISMRDVVIDILNRPNKVYTKEEARELLVHLGVLDEDGNIRPQWQDIFVKKSDISGGMYDGVDMYGREWKEEDGET